MVADEARKLAEPLVVIYTLRQTKCLGNVLLPYQITWVSTLTVADGGLVSPTNINAIHHPSELMLVKNQHRAGCRFPLHQSQNTLPRNDS